MSNLPKGDCLHSIRVRLYAMPTLAVIDGIRVTMYYADHEPAHFHAIAGEDEIVVGIADLRVIAGRAPPAVGRRVRAWARRHQRELALCWIRCRTGLKPGRIEG
jgi:Domain of unknown function (DUF4160)